MTDHDWDAQREETAWTVENLTETQGLPTGLAINLHIQTVAAAGADRSAYIDALKGAGYSGNAYTSEEDGTETIEVTIEGTYFTFAEIWRYEEAVTRIALDHCYRPDGWGFWEPEDA